MGNSGAGSGQGLLPSARQAVQKASNPLIKAGQEAKLKKATRMYESHFISTLWKEMRKSTGKNALVSGGYGEEIFTGLLDQARSEVLSQRGGVGIAEMLERQLARQGQPAPSRAGANGAMKPLAWRGRVPAAYQGDEAEAAADPQDPAPAGPLLEDSGQPLVELAPSQADPQSISAVTLPMPQGEDEESASTAWPPAPAATAPLARSAQPAAEEMDAPVQGAITSTFGLRLHPITGDIRPHQGLDLAAPSGTPIKAARAGVVRFAGTAGDYGRLVVVEHDDGSSAFYGHCKTLNVTPGQRVAQGQMVARVGMTGQATGPHLHFEVRDALGRAQDPLPMVAGRLNSAS